MNKKGMLIVISGPAGSGKGTVVAHLREMIPDLGLSISATTRGIREAVGEKDGVHYYFISRDDFEDALSRGEILEHTVYAGEYYGTPKKEVERVLSSGRDMILEIETDGAMQVKRLYPDAITIMLLPPSFPILESRLRGRGTETEEKIVTRLNKARSEVALCDRYDYVVVNETNGSQKCAEDIVAILRAEHLRPSRQKHITDNFFAAE